MFNIIWLSIWQSISLLARLTFALKDTSFFTWIRCCQLLLTSWWKFFNRLSINRSCWFLFFWKSLANTLISFIVDILFVVDISFANNFFSIIIKEIVVVVFAINVFFKSNYRYIRELSMNTRNIVNAIVIINFSSTKNQTQTQTRKIRIFSTIEFVEYSLEWTIDRIVFKIVVRQFHVVIVEYKITSIYLKFLSINFRVNDIENLLVDDMFVEK